MIEDFDKHIDSLINIIESIKLNEVIILTGDNGTGKSLVRKTLVPHINKLTGNTKGSLVSDISMQRRTEDHSDFGGLGFVLRDYDDSPTSMETYRFLKGIFEEVGKRKRYLVLDEPELGASREVQRAFAKYINKFYEDIHDSEKSYGLLVITHSEEIVKYLKSDKFINIQGLNKEEWLERKIKDVDLEEIENMSFKLKNALNKRIKKVR